MKLLHRSPRPLSRDPGSFRDDRLFIIACDDRYAPKQYFDFFRLSRVQIYVVPTVDGTSNAADVLARLLKINHDPDDELWMLLDVDHCDRAEHVRAFAGAIAEARRKGINVAVSKPCFELWLLLHYIDETSLDGIRNARDVEAALRKAIGEYDKTNLKREHYPLSSVGAAHMRAMRLDSIVEGGEIPSGNTSRVYLIWRSIIQSSPKWQLPEELASLLR